MHSTALTLAAGLYQSPGHPLALGIVAAALGVILGLVSVLCLESTLRHKAPTAVSSLYAAITGVCLLTGGYGIALIVNYA